MLVYELCLDIDGVSKSKNFIALMWSIFIQRIKNASLSGRVVLCVERGQGSRSSFLLLAGKSRIALCCPLQELCMQRSLSFVFSMLRVCLFEISARVTARTWSAVSSFVEWHECDSVDGVDTKRLRGS